MWAARYERVPVIEGDVVYARKLEKNDKGYWYLLNYEIITEEFD